MSETISNLIAFVGFLILFSMIIQAVQQALKNTFKLKTGVWQRFFINIYKREFSPELEKEDKPLQEKKPVAKPDSFWKRTWTGEYVGEFDKRLQRLKNIVHKADKIIKTAKATLCELKNLDPDSKNIRDQILSKTEPLVDNLEEILGLKLKPLLEIYDKFCGGKIKNSIDEIEKFFMKYHDLQLRVDILKTREIREFRDDCEKLLNKINEIERLLSDYRFQIEHKIDAWTAQVNEEYTRNMLKWTFFTGMAFVIAFNADSFTLYRYLSVDSKAQEALIQQVTESTVKTQKANAHDLNVIESALREENVDDAKNAILKLSGNLQEDFKVYGKTEKTDKIKELKKKAEKVDSQGDRKQKLKVLKDTSVELSRLYLELQKLSIDYQISRIALLDLPLIPVGWIKEIRDFTPKSESVFVWFIIKKIGGLTLTTILITFGAPFWNDILSALVGIKSMTLKKR